MRRKIYFDSYYGIETYAMCEGDKLAEFCVERAASGAVIGNIYKGRVTNVLNGMQAAFVDCGLERHCYISVADLISGNVKPEDGEIDIPLTLNLHEGDEILVQITKLPQGKKGAKVTTHVSFVGKYLIFLPDTPFIGVSAKIDDAELRKNLLFSAKRNLDAGEGMIVRTAAPYALLCDKRNEVNYFRNLYKLLRERFETAAVGELLYSDSPLYMRVLRDLMLQSGDEIHVGNEQLYKGVKELTETFSSAPQAKLILHDPHRDMIYSEGVAAQLNETLSPKVNLSNGAYLIIERTEALTVIDVNTGKFTGEDSLEQTVYRTNILAAHEIARQVKLRNLGGLFVVDFIDMKEENHCKAIVDELEKALRADKSKCRVLPMSKFGLVEFNRKRTGSSSPELFIKGCSACGGTGIMRSDEGLLCDFRARLLQILADGAASVCVDMNFDLANRLINYPELKEYIARLYPQARIYIVFHRTYKEDKMYFRTADNNAVPDEAVLLY